MKKCLSNTTYTIVDKIAEGGMGAVYKAQQKGIAGFEKTVAIKTLLGKLSKNRKFIDRFILEAKLVANLVHENIVQIYQLDRYRGKYFFVLEFVNGISLHNFADILNKAKIRLPEKLAVFTASRIARGLAYAHTRCDASGEPLSIVHCDVCPQNIMISTEGLPKLTDFGIAKATITGNIDSVDGKLPFMSPEQARGEKLDFRSDIFSLGMVLFYMISGKSARQLNASFEDILKQARENEINWDALPDNIDKELLKIITKMLASSPDERYQDTAELARDLEYHIYKDGYGPTIVTLSEYMRKQMPALFEKASGYKKEDNKEEYELTQVLIREEEKTMNIKMKSIHKFKPLSPEDGHNNDLSKTVKLPNDFFGKNE